MAAPTLPEEIAELAAKALEKTKGPDGTITLSVSEQRDLKKHLEEQNKELIALKQREKDAKAEEKQLKEQLKAAKDRRVKATEQKKQHTTAAKRKLDPEFKEVAGPNEAEAAEMHTTPEPEKKKPRRGRQKQNKEDAPLTPKQIRAMVSPKARALAGLGPEGGKDPRKEKAMAGLALLREAGISGLKLPSDDFDKKIHVCNVFLLKYFSSNTQKHV